MSNFLENELRRALRPVDPGDEFTRKVLARIQDSSQPQRRKSGLPTRVAQWVPAALAASLLLAIIMKHDPPEEQMVAEGLRAREELIAALRVTSEKLDLAYHVVHHDAGSESDGCRRLGVCP